MSFTTPTRAALQAFIKDQRTELAFEQLFNSLAGGAALQPGDVVYTGSRSRAGALPANGAAVSRTLYPDLFAALVTSAAVTITIASPGVVTWTGHGLSNANPVVFSTNGALPTGLVAGTVYYVKNATTNTFQLSATSGGSAINTSGSQSGTQTATAYPFGVGDGSTTFDLPTVAAVGGCGAFIVY